MRAMDFEYNYLKHLHYKTDESKFQKMMLDFLLSPTVSVKFMEYFFKQCCEDQNFLWAAFLRKNTVLNTKIHAEAFHWLLKYVYLDKKQNRLIVALLKDLWAKL